MANQEPPQDDSTTSVPNSITHEIQLQSISTPTYNQHNSPTVLHISENVTASAAAEAKKRHEDVVSILLIMAIMPFLITLLILFTNIVIIVTLPILLVSFFMNRLVQLFRHGNGYETTLQRTLTLRFWIYAQLFFIAFTLMPLFLTAKLSRGFKKSLFKILPFEKNDRIYGVAFFLFLAHLTVFNFSIRLMPSLPLGHKKNSLYVRAAVHEIIDCLTFWIFQLMAISAVPAFKHHKLLGLYTRRWIHVLILVLISHNIIRIFTHTSVWLIRELVCKKLDPGTHKNSIRYFLIEKILQRKYLVYYTIGMKHNINNILSSLMLLLTWVLYFRSHLNETPRTQSISEFVTWTCVTFLIASVLWLIKTCVLLSWEVSVVYKSLNWRHKILEGGLQLYFLSIFDNHSCHIFDLLQKHPTPTAYSIQQLCALLLTAKSTLSEENYTSAILDKVKSFHQDDNDKGSIEEILKKIIQCTTKVSSGCCRKRRVRHYWSDFEDQLRDYMDSSTEITLEILETWVEKARNNCLFLANTLSSIMELADCLNKIMSVLLVAATFILWLLLTKLASTKIFVIIASPLLAATFVFGDTCKILFQGVFFVYVIHPFDVSDLCVIDGIMMEVKTIGIWKTTFAKVGTQEKVMYPNSELSNKNIINHKSEFDWNDYIEFDVDSMDEEKIKKIKQDIEKYLVANEDKFAPNYSWVVVTTNDNIKIATYIRHIVDVKNCTNFECLKKKHKLRSEFVLYVKNLMDQKEVGN